MRLLRVRRVRRRLRPQRRSASRLRLTGRMLRHTAIRPMQPETMPPRSAMLPPQAARTRWLPATRQRPALSAHLRSATSPPRRASTRLHWAAAAWQARSPVRRPWARARSPSAETQPPVQAQPLRTRSRLAVSRLSRLRRRRASQSVGARRLMAPMASPRVMASSPARPARTWRSARVARLPTAARRLVVPSQSVAAKRRRATARSRSAIRTRRSGRVRSRWARTTHRMARAPSQSAMRIPRQVKARSHWATAAWRPTALSRSVARRARPAPTVQSPSAIPQPRRAPARLRSATAAASPPTRRPPAPMRLHSGMDRRRAAAPVQSPSAPRLWPRIPMRRPSARTRPHRVQGRSRSHKMLPRRSRMLSPSASVRQRTSRIRLLSGAAR